MAKSIYDLRKGKNDQIYQVLKVKAGHYRIFPLSGGEAIGEIIKRHDDWYGELALDGNLFANSCGDSLTEVTEELERCIVHRGEGKYAHIHQKNAEEWTARLIERLKK